MLPTVKEVIYGIDIKRVMRSKLVLGIADGWLSADGEIIYRASDLKVALVPGATRRSRPGPDKRAAKSHMIAARRIVGMRAQDADEAIMRRVVVTGMGIVSSIGNNTQEVLASLREAKSGISRADKYAELGFRCQVHGAPSLDPAEDGRPPRDALPRRRHRAGITSRWSRRSATPASRTSDISNERTGIIMGSGGPSTRTIVEAADTARTKGPKRVGPFAVPKAMSSTASATLATWFKIKGVNYSISSACATSNHCIGNAAEMIQWGKQDMIFAGGCEELDWTLSVLFDAMGAMSIELQPDARQGLARLRQGPRRLRDRGRRRRAGARRARARQGARREDLRRDRRLRRDLRRPRHGGAVRRGRDALHEAWRSPT